MRFFWPKRAKCERIHPAAAIIILKSDVCARIIICGKPIRKVKIKNYLLSNTP